MSPSQYGATTSVQASLTALSQAQHGLANLPGAATSLLAQYAGSGPKKPIHQADGAQGEHADGVVEEKNGPDPRDVDRIVGEMITLSGRWALYRRFVWNRLNVSRTHCRCTSWTTKTLIDATHPAVR